MYEEILEMLEAAEVNEDGHAAGNEVSPTDDGASLRIVDPTGRLDNEYATGSIITNDGEIYPTFSGPDLRHGELLDLWTDEVIPVTPVDKGVSKRLKP
jgi:hypothetical protein